MSAHQDPHARPEHADDHAVEAAGKVSEAMEWVERARGRLYDFHQLIGRADFLFEEAADALESAGRDDLAERIRHEAIGCNVLPGRWTFQVVDEFNDLYYATVSAVECAVRDALMDGRRHVYESELKDRRRTVHQPGHEWRPHEAASRTGPA